MERDSKTTKSYRAECTTNGERTCTGPGEYTLSDFLTSFKLPSLVTVITGYHSGDNEEDFSLASGQQLKIHAVHKNGTIVAKTFNKEPQNVYIPMDCCQLAELRPNGIKDFLDDSPITFQEVLHHFQFPLFIQFVDYQTDDAIADLYSRILKLERIVKEEMVLCSATQNDKAFLYIIPRNLDIRVSVNQEVNLAKSLAIKEKEEHIYEEIKVSELGHYTKLSSRVQSFGNNRSSEMEQQSVQKPKQIDTAANLLINFNDKPEEIQQQSQFYDFQDSSRLLPPDKQTCKETSAFGLRSTSESDQITRDISKMSVMEVSELLCSHNLGCFAERFRMEEIDGTMLKDLDAEALKALGLDAFQIKKLLKLIQGWKPRLSSC